MGPTTVVLLMQKQAEANQKLRQRYMAPPPAANVAAARSLTHEQARELVVHYWVNQVISMARPVEIDVNGDVTWPKPKDKIKLQLTIDGVAFTPDNPQARGWVETRELDLRNVVMVVRFTQYLKDRWGVSTIFWGGLGIGRDGKIDTHSEGLAMDFHGAVTSFGHFDVQKDWGDKPVPVAIGGNGSNTWPVTANKTSYRLAIDPLDFGALARSAVSPTGFFWDVYQYLTTQARHDSAEPRPRIGEGSGILHPDTPWSAYLRKGHQNHFHFEVALK